MDGLIKISQKNDQSMATDEVEDIIKKKYNTDDYVRERFMKTVQHYDRLAHKNSRWYSFLQATLIVISPLTPFIVGLEAIIVNSTLLKILALLLTVIIAVLGSYLTT